MRGRYWEDFVVGEAWETRGLTLTESMIVDFALMWDPQHMHTDKVRAEAGPFGGLIASGFQTLAASFRLFHDLGLLEDTNIAGPSLGEVSWPAPVRAGDTIRCRARVVESRASASKPDRGIVRFAIETLNQHDEIVCTFFPLGFIRTRAGANG